MVWFWYFLIYSFLGFLVEVVYVRVVGGAKRDRKCRLLLPICPVYGLGALAVLALPPFVQARPLLLLPAAGAACTAVEYLTSLFYEKVFRVSFWDYSHLRCSHNILCRNLLNLTVPKFLHTSFHNPRQNNSF